MSPMALDLNAAFALPEDSARAVLIGRVWRSEVEGPAVVACRGGEVFDISHVTPTIRDLLEESEPARIAGGTKGKHIGSLAEILAATPRETRTEGVPHLLAPLDLQAIKAAG